jgi:epoxyqueuosine reductase
MAGLGVIGQNNLLITPQYGASVRLRAMFVDGDCLPDQPVRFTPCEACSAPCRTACPQNTFKKGKYLRSLCNIQMKKNEANQKKLDTDDGVRSVIQYCRACEWACPVSRGEINSGI